jgi:hypothetical protein
MSETEMTEYADKEHKPWRFQRNRSGNPAGKPKGARHKTTKPESAAAIATKGALPAPSASEANAIADAVERKAARRARVSVSAQINDGVLQIGPSHLDHAGFVARLLDSFGTESQAFTNQAIGRLSAIMRCKGSAIPTETELNAGLAAIDGMRPADEMEAMLAIQMVATHETAMEMLTRAKQAEFMPQLQECGSLAVKLMRTYAAQVEALGRLRRGGEQRVIVQHLNVNEGGQAIVGAVSHPGGGGK